MPSPPYLSVTTFPYSRVVTQAEFNGGSFGGTANEVWFEVILSTKEALGGFTNAGGTFTPRMRLYESDQTTLLKNVGGSTAWYSIRTADTYYVRVTRSGGGASDFDFTVQFDVAPVDGNVSFVPGDILINDDSGGNPVASIYAIDGTFKGFIDQFPTGEDGYFLPTGESLWHDVADIKGGGFGSFALYGATLMYVGSTVLTLTEKSLVTAAASAGDFYVVEQSSGDVYRVELDLTTTLLGTLPLSGTLSAIGASLDGSILYWTEQSGNADIERWDLNGAVPLSALHTIAGYDTVNDTLAYTPNGNPGDIAIMADGSVVTSWFDDSLAQYKVIHISSAGALLNTCTQATDQVNHLIPQASSSTDIILWNYLTGTLAQANFGILNLSTCGYDAFTTDLMSLAENMVSGSDLMFAPSTSCTFSLLGAAVVAPGSPGSPGDETGIIGPLVWVHWPRVLS